jgi:hypothetical protein
MLQAAVDTTTTPQSVQGRLTVTEPGTAYPNPTADAARKDRAAWLDSTGQIQIFGADEVPQSAVPGWKAKGWGVRWIMPIWVYLAGAGGVLLVGVLILLAWLFFAKRRREDAQQQDQYISEAEERPSNKPWATRVSRSTSPRRKNQNSWWEDGQLSTPPGSRGATEDRPAGNSLREPRSSRGPRSNKRQQHVRGEGQLQRPEAWGDEPELPGAYR